MLIDTLNKVIQGYVTHTPMKMQVSVISLPFFLLLSTKELLMKV
jgi:hypothetical protein